MIRYMLPAVLLFFAYATNATADLILNISGDVGSNVTTWDWSGSYVVGDVNNRPGEFSLNDERDTDGRINFFSHETGELSGEFASDAAYNNTRISATGGVITGSVSGAHSIDGLFLDSDGAVSGSDDFAWYATGAFADNETLTFSGTSMVAADITTFGEGATAIANAGDTFTVNSTNKVTPFSMTFSANSTAVPEPSSFALIGLAGLGLVVRRRKRRTV